jgi:hypothetical protein
MISPGELERIKRDNPVDQLARQWVKLRKGGKLGWVGRCPLCSEHQGKAGGTKFECSADKWVCAGCSQGGDVIKLVQLREFQSEVDTFALAIERLGGTRERDPEAEAAAEAERARKAQEQERASAEFRERARKDAFYKIWRRRVDIAGTPAEAYLTVRGVVAPPDAKLGCIHAFEYWMPGEKGARLAHTGPVMLAPIVRGGKFSGIHITYLDPTAPKGKLALFDPDSAEPLPAKKVRGSKRGGHIELVTREAPRRLVIGEGIEKVCAVWRALAAAGWDLSDTAFWTSIDLGNLGGKHLGTVAHPTLKDAGGRARRVPGPDPDLGESGIEIPDSVETIIILGDSSSDEFITRCTVARAIARWQKDGRRIVVAWSPKDASGRGIDFDELFVCEEASSAVSAIAQSIAAAMPLELVRAEPEPPAPVEPAPPALRSIEEELEQLAAEAARQAATLSGGGNDEKPPEPPSRSEGGGPAGPQAWGYDVDKLNKQFALVLMGSKSVIFYEKPTAMIEDQKRMLAVDAFHNWHANRFTQICGSDGKIKPVTWSKRWMSDRRRRQYDGIEFYPDPDNAPGTPDYLNLWSGFAVSPARERDARRYKTFADHLLNNVCSGNKALHDWLFGFFAHIVQRPRQRLGVALVMRGRMGSGKTKVGEVFGRLFPRHYFLVDDPRYVTGQFNAHMATCLLLQADEAVWAGDKAAEGRLKGLITSPIQQIEAKGVDPIRLPNFVRLVMTSNEDWVVPAGKDERRFAVLDVDPRCAQRHEYFREMDEELADGGLEALLADLLAFDLESVDLWKIPRTEALLEQKIRSLNSVESWWFERLTNGSTARHGQHWKEEVSSTTLFNDYIATADKIGVKRKQEETVFGISLAKLVPNLRRVKRTVEVEDERGGASTTRRAWCYALPPLVEARAHFELIVGQRVQWPSEDDADRASEVESLAESEF